jgi:hypothetical protein
MNLFFRHLQDGAFRLAIEHQIPIVPITFADNKKVVLYFFSGSPGLMRAKIHSEISTVGKTGLIETNSGAGARSYLLSAFNIKIIKK